MGRTALSKPLPLFISLLAAYSLTAADALVDDHSDGTDANDFEGYWYYYDDNSGVKEDDRPQAAPASTPSVIQVEFTEKPREAFGDTNDTWLVKEYTFKVDEESGNRFATMPFIYGESWEATAYEATPYVGIGTTLAPEGRIIDLSGATTVSFRIRSHTADLVVDFKVETHDISMDSSFAYYQTAIPATTAWTDVTVPLGDLAQPAWTPAAYERPFDVTRVTKLAWEIAGGKNKNIESDVLDLDDIRIDAAVTLPSVYIPTVAMGSAGAGIFSNFAGNTPQSSPLKTSWYAYDDHEIGGTTLVKSGAVRNTATGLLDLLWEPGSGPEGGNDVAPFLEMSIGPPIEQAGSGNSVVNVQGFAGIGVNLYDSAAATYFDATTGRMGSSGGSGTATGIYFEYYAGGDYRYMTLQVNDINDVGDSRNPTRKNLRGEGIVYFRNFRKTEPEWKAVYIPFTELIVRDDWEGYNPIPLDLTSLAKLQFKVQGDSGDNGILMVDNLAFPGCSNFEGVGVASTVTRRSPAALLSVSCRGSIVLVNWYGTEPVTGRISVVNIEGAVIETIAISPKGTAFSIAGFPAGMYIAKLSGSEASGKTITGHSPFTILR